MFQRRGWQAPKRSATKRTAGVNLRMKRVLAEIRMKDIQPGQSTLGAQTITVSARVILNEFTAGGMAIFSSEPITPGQELHVTLDEPKRFFCKARVNFCQEIFNDSKILSAETYNYRVALRFVFDTPEEEAAVREYYEELLREYIAPNPAAA